MRFGSLFAGIGGFDLGLERAGMECAWQVEIDPYCLAVLQKHWPRVRRYADIKRLDPARLEKVDLVCGGFPCQPFSQAGKRKGTADDRHLWPEMLRVVAQARPAWVVGENVPGIVGMELDRVLLDLENEGYATQALIIPACAVDAKHRRDRVWIIAYSGDGRRRELLQSELRSECDVEADSGSDGEIPHAADSPRNEQGRQEQWAFGERARERGESKFQSDADKPRLQVREGQETIGAGANGRAAVERVCRWFPEPDVGRVAHGVPYRVDRLRALGNAVVPQVVEQIGRMILRFESLR